MNTEMHVNVNFFRENQVLWTEIHRMENQGDARMKSYLTWIKYRVRQKNVHTL